MTPKRNPGIRKSSCFLIYKSTLWNLQDRYTHNLQRSTGYQFSRVRYYVLSYGQKYIITFKHKTERCSFLFWFIWLTAFETRSTHTHTQRVFEFFWTLTNKRRSCVRFVSKSWRYPESIPKLPQKVLKMTPGRPPGGSKNVNKSWFFTFWAKSQNRWFFIKKNQKKMDSWPPPDLPWWIPKSPDGS